MGDQDICSSTTIPVSASVYTDVELVQAVIDAEYNLEHLRLENIVMEDFILKGEPTLLYDMERAIDTAMKLKSKEITSRSSKDSGSDSGTVGHSAGKSVESSVRMVQLLSDKGPRINVTTKIDMVMRVVDEMNNKLESFNKRSKRIKRNLKAKSECLDSTLQEVLEAAADFKEEVVAQGTDPITGKIAAERFIRYMEDWLKCAEFSIGKMRLRTGTLKALAVKLNQQRVVKEELSEKVDPIDFDQLKIDNDNLKVKLEEKKLHLIDLKNINGTASLVLSRYKLLMIEQLAQISAIKSKIEDMNKHVLHLDELEKEAEAETQEALKKLNRMQNLSKSYLVPGVMDYIKLKANVEEIRKNLVLYRRRNTILKWKLTAVTNKMRAVTGSKEQQKSWYVHKSQREYETFFNEGSEDVDGLLEESPSNVDSST